MPPVWLAAGTTGLPAAPHLACTSEALLTNTFTFTLPCSQQIYLPMLIYAHLCLPLYFIILLYMRTVYFICLLYMVTTAQSLHVLSFFHILPAFRASLLPWSAHPACPLTMSKSCQHCLKLLKLSPGTQCP